MQRSAARVFIAFASAFLLATTLSAQFETSEVLGTVHDPSGAVVADADVTLTSQETATEAKTRTDADGNYDFFDVKLGHYTVTIEKAGFSKFSATDIGIDVGVRRRVDAELKVGAASETMTVTSASLIETDSSEHSQTIGTEAMVDLPLNGRHYADLALLSTNVHVSPMAISFSPSGTPREGSFNVNGMRSTYNDFLMDGVDNNSYGTSNQRLFLSQVVQASPDAPGGISR